MTLTSKIKEAIKRIPPLYDLVDRLRVVHLDATERFLDEFSRQRESVRFVQIGANDGMSWDPLRRFIIRDRWSGVLVEPVPGHYERLVYNYKHVKQDLAFVNAAISVHDETKVDFYVPSRKLLARINEQTREYLWRCASFSREHLESAVRNQTGGSLLDDVEELQVPCITVNALVEQYFPSGELDLLVCDAEGYDAKIIGSIDFERVQVRAVIFESHNLTVDDRASVELLLTSNGFALTKADGDTIAVR